MGKSKPVSGNAFDISVLKRIYRFVIPYKKKFATAAWLTFLLAFISPLRPLLVQYTVDHCILGTEQNKMTMMLLIMVCLLLLQTVVQYFHTYITSFLGQIVIRDIRIKLFSHIASLKLKFFDNTPIGTLVTRTISDLETIADIFSEGVIVIIGDLLQLLVIIAVMFYKDWRLSLISLSTIPLLIVATRIFQKGINKAFREVRIKVAQLNTFVQEHITGMSIVQAFNREQEEMRRFENINREHMNANIKSIWYYSVFFPVVEILTATSIGLVVWWGTRGVIEGSVSLGNVIAFIMFINLLFRPIRELADKFNTLQMGVVSSERVFKLLDTNDIIINNGTYEHVIAGNIEFRNVWFTYTEKENESETEWILKDISFKIKKGETLALIGATGAGKSSVISLLGRLYEFQKGEILVDDVDIRKYELHSLRKQVAVVLQDVFLFSDSIFNNITLNDPAISRQRVIEAAKIVGAHDFIMRLPGDYDFNVMERGAMLSVGQRQLLSFIRAYVFNPKVLILDEATSSIDSESEELMQKATSKLTESRTSIVIAHRLATIQNADRILVFDHGKIIEEGNHQELLAKNGAYRELYEIQFSNVSSD